MVTTPVTTSMLNSSKYTANITTSIGTLDEGRTYEAVPFRTKFRPKNTLEILFKFYFHIFIFLFKELFSIVY